MRGNYRDIIHARCGRTVFDSGWKSNTIVDSAWTLIAGLLKNDPGLDGILFWAVGSGSAAWDTTPRPINTSVTRLVEEIDRIPVTPESIIYIDSDGNPSPAPSVCIEAGAIFTWNRNVVLREFGLFGGNGTPERDSGLLINYVAHPHLEISAGQSITRRMRFTLSRTIGPNRNALPVHWLGEERVDRIDGVGAAFTAILNRAGVQTIGDLAGIDPMNLGAGLPLMRGVELRAKARAALRTAANMRQVTGLNHLLPGDILTTPLSTLITDSGGAADAVILLREQVGALELALDNRYLRQVSIGRLARPL